MNFAFTGNRPKELFPDEDETAKIRDYKQKKRLKTVAGNELMPVFKCGLCDKTFLTQKALHHHVRNREIFAYVVFLTAHLSPADLGPVLSGKRKL